MMKPIAGRILIAALFCPGLEKIAAEAMRKIEQKPTIINRNNDKIRQII